MSWGDRREDIFLDDVDRQDFIKTLAETCQKTGWEVHAYCLMRNHFHLVLETPNANLLEGMRWLLGAYTIRLNHRHSQFGHVFSGRYKALLVEGSGTGYLKPACDYVHLNPVRAKLLGPEDRLLGYPWSSLVWYMAAPEYRPKWVRVDRVLGEHGPPQDTPAGRQEFERRLEARRLEEADEGALKTFRRGWCLVSEQCRKQMLELMEGRLGENHSGELRSETADAKAQRIISEQLSRLGWTAQDIAVRRKGHPEKLAIAARLRKETTHSVKSIAGLLHLGAANSARVRLQERAKTMGGRPDLGTLPLAI